jgi:hypothetical protein
VGIVILLLKPGEKSSESIVVNLFLKSKLNFISPLTFHSIQAKILPLKPCLRI